MKKKLFLTILIILLLISMGLETTKTGVAQTVDDSVLENSSKLTVVQIPDTAVVHVPDIESILKLYLKTKNHEDFFLVAKLVFETAKKYKLPGETVLAISILESGYGSSVIACDKKNYFGIRAFDVDPYHMASDFSQMPLELAIDYQIQILKQDYFDKYDSLEEIAKHYCKKWEHWLREINTITQDIKNYFKKEGVK